jgi:hypothetical protein
MHFKQYQYCNHFTFKTDHKALEWLATVLNAYNEGEGGSTHYKIFASKLCIEQKLNT